MFGVEDPLREVVEVIRDRQVIEDALRRRTGERRNPVDDPQQQEHRERDHS